MKRNRSKGFTLIELMVVISIITLLSSVVLASVKTAREKAQITKTVAEMKSLQQALELYRNQFGVYPQDNAGDDELGNSEDTGVSDLLDGFDNFIKTNLVNNKFISKVPHAPNYPKNCNTDCATNGNVLVYSINLYLGEPEPGIPDLKVFCGNKKVENYVLFLLTNQKVDLPILDAYDPNGPPANNYGAGFLHNAYQLKAYCLAM